MTKPHLYFHTPVAIFKALVNMPGTITYPISEITFDGVSLGAYTDIAFDATVTFGTTEGGDDLGRVRATKVATSSILYIARSSKGIEDGTVTIQDNAYITVWDDYRVWAKLPYFNLDTGRDYKDGDVLVGTFNTDIPPVANTGPGFADYIDSGTSLITVEFPGGGLDLSFPMANGATITTYAWDVKDGTITVGTAASAVITATFPAGFRWVQLTVTDSNAVTHTARCPVLAVDPDDDPTIKNANITQRLEIKGQTLDVEIFEDMSRTDYPDGTLVMFWWDAPADESDRDHMKFIGWTDTENYSVKRDKKGIAKSTTIHCIDVNGRLEKLPGFPQALSRIEEDSPWSYMPNLDMSKSLFYLLFWHSTAINIADFFLPADGTDYVALRLDASGASLFDQVNTQAMKMVPDHLLTCNSKGQIEVKRNWMLDDEGDRPTSAPIITEDDWNEMSVEYNRHPKVHVLRSGAILASTSYVVIDGIDTIPLVFSISPGDSEAFGQGVSEQTENEGLALSQDALNKAEGHRYALLNSRFGEFSFTDPTGSDFWNYEPADMFRVQLNIGASYAAQRNLGFTTASGLIKSIDVQYRTDKTGTAITPKVVWQKETSGYPAVTFEPEESEPVDYTWTPPDLSDPVVFGGDITGYILWDSTQVLRTYDLDAASPTWEDISGTIDGNIYDGQYMMVDASTVGMWLMTSTGIFFCADIMAASPTWSEKRSIETAAAAETAPPTGTIEFGCMTHYWSQPGHLCVATNPVDDADNWQHAYFHVTEDYGASWTVVDMSSFTHTDGANTRGYSHTSHFAMNSFRTSPGTIYCVRSTSREGSASGSTAVFVSADLGYTWTKEFTAAAWAANGNMGGVLNPYPDATSPGYVAIGQGVSNAATLYKTTDGFDTAAAVTFPTGGYDRLYFPHTGAVRPNKRPFDADHIIAMWRIGAGGTISLMESLDGGATWSNLEDLSSGQTTPNGWPPDDDQWVIIEPANSLSANTIRLTLDNFVTFSSKVGNLADVLSDGTWGTGFGNGFALPKVGANA